jgi:hypothetical protein
MGFSAGRMCAETSWQSCLDVILGDAAREATQDGRLETSAFRATMAENLHPANRGGVYRRSIVKILRALAARSRSAALMQGTRISRSRLIAKLRMQASVRGLLPLRARQRSSS